MSDRKPTGESRLQLAGEPRVQLLPPSVAAREKSRSTRRLLVLLVILAVVIVAGGYVFGLFRAASAQVQLVEAQARSAELLAEQGKYSEAKRVDGLLAKTADVQQLGTSTEILWQPVIAEISARLPAGVSLFSATMSSRTPWGPENEPSGPLRQPNIAGVQLVLLSPGVPDAVALSRQLSTLTGYADSVLMTSVTEDGAYKTTVNLTLQEDALALRFGPEPEVDDKEPEQTDETTEGAEG